MDSAIDLSDASKALDLSNIRFQLMWAYNLNVQHAKADQESVVALKTPSPFT